MFKVHTSIRPGDAQNPSTRGRRITVANTFMPQTDLLAVLIENPHLVSVVYGPHLNGILV